MIVRTVAAAAVALSSSGAFALSVGDLAFTAFNADEDGWSVVALADIAPGSTIYFTENTWDATGGEFTGSEAFYTWDLGAESVAAGKVVRFSSVQNAARGASVGSFSATGTANLSGTSETLFAYLGDPRVPTGFLAGLSTEDFSAGAQLAGTGLFVGASAVSLPSGADYAEYAGTRSGFSGYAQYAPLVNDASMWQSQATGDFATQVPDLTAFSLVTPVPEPDAYAMMMSGLALFGLAVRRRAL